MFVDGCFWHGCPSTADRATFRDMGHKGVRLGRPTVLDADVAIPPHPLTVRPPCSRTRQWRSITTGERPVEAASHAAIVGGSVRDPSRPVAGGQSYA